jgi:uncharacterized protein YjbI with pentapeptide repeats
MPQEIKIEKKASEVIQPHSTEEAAKAIQQKKDLSGANLVGMILRNLTAVGAILRKTNLKNADLSHSLFINPNFYRASLNGAAVNNTMLVNGDLVKTDFTSADLSESGIIASEAERAVFNQANLRNAGIFASNLKEADFRNANLSNARMGAVNVEGADFSGADTTGARAYRVDWSKAKTPPNPLPEPLIQLPAWTFSVLIGGLAGVLAVLIYFLIRRGRNPQPNN